MKPTSIYGLSDPFTGEMRYIGRSTDPKIRFRSHLKCARRCIEDTYKARWIRTLLEKEQLPVLTVLETVNDGAWQDREVFWIAEYRKRGCNLTNLSDGGDGNNGFKHRPESIEKFRAKLIGTRKSPEQRANLSRAKMGTKHSEETKRKMSISRTGRIMRRESIAKTADANRGKQRSEESKNKQSIRAKERAIETGLYICDENGDRVAKRCSRCRRMLTIDSYNKGNDGMACYPECRDCTWKKNNYRRRISVPVVEYNPEMAAWAMRVSSQSLGAF